MGFKLGGDMDVAKLIVEKPKEEDKEKPKEEDKDKPKEGDKDKENTTTDDKEKAKDGGDQEEKKEDEEQEKEPELKSDFRPRKGYIRGIGSPDFGTSSSGVTIYGPVAIRPNNSGHSYAVGSSEFKSGCWKATVTSCGHWVMMGIIANASPVNTSYSDSINFAWATSSQVYFKGKHLASNKQVGSFPGWDKSLEEAIFMLFEAPDKTYTLGLWIVKRDKVCKIQGIPPAKYRVHINLYNTNTNVKISAPSFEEISKMERKMK